MGVAPPSLGRLVSTPGVSRRAAVSRTRRRPRRTAGALVVARCVERQWKLSPQAQLPDALGLSSVKPCFWMESSKSMVAPSR